MVNQVAVLKASLKRWKGKLRQLQNLKKGATSKAQLKGINHKIRDVKARIHYYEKTLKKAKKRRQ